MSQLGLRRIWRRLPFTVRFVAVLAVTGVLIAIVTFQLAERQAETGAAGQAKDRIDIVTGFLTQERQSLNQYAGEIATQLARVGTTSDPALIEHALLQDTATGPPGDVLVAVTPS